MSKLVLLCFIARPNGGTASYINNYIKHAKHLDSEVHFRVLYLSSDSDSYINHARSLGIDVVVLQRKNRYFRFLDILTIWNYLRKLPRSTTIIEAHNSNFGFFFFLPALFLGFKNRILMLHSSRYSEYKNRVFRNKILTRLTMSLSSHLFACSNEAGASIFKRRNYIVFPGGCCSSDFTFSNSLREKVRVQLGIDNDECVLLQVGRFSPVKNHSFSLDLLCSLVKNSDGIRYRMIILGDGELKDFIKRKIIHLGLSDYVTMVGSTHKVINYLCAADIFIAPSFFEGLPITAIEAQLNGLPCLISERISHEVRFQANVYFLPIDRGITPWQNVITTNLIGRSDVDLKSFDNSGLNIENLAIKRIDFYLSI